MQKKNLDQLGFEPMLGLLIPSQLLYNPSYWEEVHFIIDDVENKLQQVDYNGFHYQEFEVNMNS